MALLCAVAWASGLWAALGVVTVDGGDTVGRLGSLPPAWLFLLLASFSMAMVRALRLTPADAAPLALALVAWLPWIPGRIPPAFFILDGPLATVAAVATAAFVVGRAMLPALATRVVPSGRAQIVAAGALAALLSLTAAWRMAPVLPDGDEPHYLIITQSLLTDGDLQIENNHQRGDFTAYTDVDLKPDFVRRARDGQIYSIHAPGLPALLLPAFALGGYRGVVLFLTLLSAAVGVLAWRMAYQFTGSTGAAWIGWMGVALSVPFFFQGFTIYPDGPAALLVLAVVATLVARGQGALVSMVRGGCIAALPWLHTRYAILAMSLSLVLVVRTLWISGDAAAVPSLVRRLRTLALTLVLPLVSVCAWLWFFHVVYGRIDPRAPYGFVANEHLSQIPIGLTGLLLDQQFGLLPNAPIYVFALAGLVTLWTQRPRLTIELAVIAVPYVLAVAGFHMWWGGHSSPARFLVPVLLPLALPLAVWWQRHESRAPRAAAVLALGVSVALTVTLALASRGALVYNTRDGYALWLDVAAPAVNLAHALPSLFQAGVRDTWMRGTIWMAAAVIAWLASRALEQRLMPKGLWVLVSGLVVVCIVLAAASAAWAVTGRAALEPGTSLLRYAASQCGGDVPLHLRIPDESRRQRVNPVGWTGRDLPPGQYQVVLASTLRTNGHVTVALGRPDAILTECPLMEAPPGLTLCEVSLPAGAARLYVQPDPAARRTLTGLELALDTDGGSDACDVRAERVISDGGLPLFVTGGRVFAEGAGGWIAGGGRGEFAIAALSPLRFRLRNGPRPNQIIVSSQDWREEWAARPGETREVTVPRARGSLVRFAVEAAGGFRPSDVEPGSRDWRYLGAWIESAK